MKFKAFALSCSLAVAVFVPSSAAMAQSSSVNSARIEVLERKIRALQARLGDNIDSQQEPAVGASGNRVIADISARMGSLEEQLRKLTGRMEEFEYRQRQLSQTLELVQQEMALQRADIAKAASQPAAPAAAEKATTTNTSSVTSAPTETVAKPAVVVELPDGDAAAQYDYAFNFIRKNDLSSGQIAMEAFMKTNAGNPLVGNAKFWLGRIYLQQGKNANAAQNFLSLIEEHPNHAKRGEALVDLADVLIKLDSSNDACNALLEFRRVEDKASGRLKSRAARLSEQAKCG